VIANIGIEALNFNGTRSKVLMYESILNKIKARQTTVGIIGLGYVGIPLAIAVLRAGHRVLGFDIDAARVANLKAGKIVIKHIPTEPIEEATQKGFFDATTDFDRLGEPDVLIIAVPTPLSRYREPDLSYVMDTTRAIARKLRRGQLIVLESTTYPGTTSGEMRPVLEMTSGLKVEEDFYLAFSPEREDPGNPSFDTATIPKVVGGEGPRSQEIAVAIYQTIVAKVVPVTNSATAEAVKLTENIFRAVNIALVNELKVVFSAMNIDVWEVIDAAKTKPFGFMPFYPGPGLGGHCIPIDPFYLTWKAREFDVATRFIELAGEINTRMPYHVVEKISEALSKHRQKAIAGARILVIGIAYKKNIDDMRESPSLKLIELLEERGAITQYHDPFIPVIPMTREHAALAGRSSIPLEAATLRTFDAVLIATDHDLVDYEALVKTGVLVIDTRNACTRAGVQGENIVKV
jgi:UDP-N-acetyl-D-glucosamine dehydrogenase